MHDKLPPGITLIKADDFKTWLMDIRVIDSNPIYDGEIYRLKFAFSPQYPIEVRAMHAFQAAPDIHSPPTLRKATH